jgi:hypothetical protein
MQGRVSNLDDIKQALPPEDATLEEAVARFTTAATNAGRPELVLSVDQWRTLVLDHLSDTNPNAYFQAVVARLGSASSLDDLNLWLSLANNIWNATPQPDRGGKTALELSAPWRSRSRTIDA